MLNIWLSLIFILWPAAAEAAENLSEIQLSPNDRILVFAPHPDDEVLGAGGVLQRAKAMNLPLKVVFFTLGDSNQWSFLLYRRHFVLMPQAVAKMGLVRRDEAVAASSILGVPKDDLIFLGYPDFGTINIWYAHWNNRPPLRSILTRVTKVPYKDAYRPGAPYKGEEILKDLGDIIRDFRPTRIFVSHPADHNGDHLAMYLFTRIALWDTGLEEAIALHPYLIHRVKWPRPIGFHPSHPLVPPAFLDETISWQEFHLTREELDLKKSALQAHTSQFVSSRKYLLSFIRPNEIFGDFPTVHLHANREAALYTTRSKFVPNVEFPDELNDQEKGAFVGVEWKFVRRSGNDLVISIAISKPLAQDVEASVYIFGYNRNTPFKAMPKIKVRLGFLSYTVYDQAKRIKQSSVHVQRTPHEITITVPLKLLGNPERFLTSAMTYLGNVPLDNSSWMAVDLK